MSDNLQHAIATAYAADRAYDAALKAAGFKSRWDWHERATGHDAVRAAFAAKVEADNAMHRAFEVARAMGRAS